MPELPEVETSRRGILPHLKGQKVTEIIVRQPKLRWQIPTEIHQFVGETILDVKRRAKYLLIEFEKGTIVVHLGMSGSLRIWNDKKTPEKHDHVDLVVNNTTTLRYTDPRRFGAWLCCTNIDELPQFKKLGPEPLTDDFNSTYLYQQASARKVPIKTLIMDNHTVVGVGNIYACESLFMAKILPTRQANTITKNEITKLTKAIKIILEKSIEQGGTTLKDFLQSDGKPGYFVQTLSVYGRLGEKCINCSTLIQSQRIGQRNTFFCSKCQK